MLPVWIFLADFFLNSHCRSLFWQMVLSGRPSLYLHLVRPLHSDVSLCTLHCNQLNICDLHNVHHVCTMFTIYAQCSPNMQNDHNALNLHNLNYMQMIPMFTICKIWTCSMNWFDDISLWTLSNLQCSSQNSISSNSNVEQKLTSVFLLYIRTIVKL